ncbi:MAG: molecular chaperone TorD family protein [Anaerolineales bacterium]|nr:molecular chaperone TorD family protein [Anaerolineales bacterium]
MDKTSEQDLQEILSSRSASYAFLSCVYRQELTAQVLETLIATTAARENADAGEADRVLNMYLRGLHNADLKKVESDLAAEYAALFLNASQKPVHPFESVYTSEEHLLMQRARDEVLQEYRRAGLERIQEFKEPEDHIALEFEFMANLCNKTLEALQIQDKTAARASLEWQKRFFDEHLSVWIPRFCNDLARLAQSGFYRGIALLTAELLETERETIPALLAELAD